MLKLLLTVIVAYVICLACRSGHKELPTLRNWAYAHRGLHGKGVPENSMAAFKAALEAGYGIELDVHLLKDGNLAVIHDSLLNRTTGQAGRIEDLTTGDLANYHLEGTQQTIPEFSQVLDLLQGKIPMIIELKPVDNNHDALAQTACAMLRGYTGPYCMESFDPRCVAAVKRASSEVIRGQLAENFMKTRNDMGDFMRFAMTHCLGNILSRPDFIAYKFADRERSLSPMLCRKLWKAEGVAWTIRSQEDFDTAVAEGWIPIFEGFRPVMGKLKDGSQEQKQIEGGAQT